MPRLTTKPPKLSHDKVNGDALVYFCKKKIYMGKWGSPEAETNYRRFVAEWAAMQKPILPDKHRPTIEELAEAYLTWAKPLLGSSDFNNYQRAIGYVLLLFHHVPTDEFGPKSLGTVQAYLVQEGFSRQYCNKLVNMIRRYFNWGVGQELVKAPTADALKHIEPLRFGRTKAHETKKRDLVPDDVVERTLPILWPTVAAMVQVQRFAGMRPSEVCKMQVGDIDRSDDIWLYRPGSHKGTWRNQDKVIPLGKAEQRIIEPRLAGKGPENAVFSPRETVEEKRAFDAARRQTPLTPSQRKRQEDRAANPRSRAREFYDSGSYGRSTKRSLELANAGLPDDEKIPHWTPYQLRHTAVTETSLSDGIEFASALAGHRSLNVTKIYDHSMLEKAKELARKRK